MPQVIYDGVASTQCRKAEQRWLLGLVPTLQHHLRTVPGRGGKRDNRTSFFASLLVGMMGNALNENPRRYGLMPIADSPDSAWTMRGVEIVLFMDGY